MATCLGYLSVVAVAFVAISQVHQLLHGLSSPASNKRQPATHSALEGLTNHTMSLNTLEEAVERVRRENIGKELTTN